MVSKHSFVKSTEVVWVIRVGDTISLAKVTGEHAHLVQQVDGTQWRVDVSTDDDDGQMTWQSVKQVTAYGFFARSDKQNKGAVSPRMFGTADEVGECHETSVTLIAVVRDDTGGQSGFSHVALHLVGYRFTV